MYGLTADFVVPGIKKNYEGNFSLVRRKTPATYVKFHASMLACIVT